MAERMKRGGHKKAAHVAGPDSASQRIWDVIRALAAGGKPFTRADVEFNLGIEDKARERAGMRALPRVAAATVRHYFERLVLGGYLKGERALPRSRSCSQFSWQDYRLARDVGQEAPRLAGDGSAMRESNRERMWRALRILKGCTALDLQLAVNAACAEGGGRPLPYLSAKTYLLQLAKAGYLGVAQGGRSGRGRNGSSYRLLASMNTGPRSPIAQKSGAIYDPNLGRVVLEARR